MFGRRIFSWLCAPCKLDPEKAVAPVSAFKKRFRQVIGTLVARVLETCASSQHRGTHNTAQEHLSSLYCLRDARIEFAPWSHRTKGTTDRRPALFEHWSSHPQRKDLKVVPVTDARFNRLFAQTTNQRRVR